MNTQVAIPANTNGALAAASKEFLTQLYHVEDEILKLPQVMLPTDQVLHAGCYARTIFIPKDTVLTGAFMQIPTILIISGHIVINNGSGTTEIKGYKVLQGSAGRKQIGRTIEDTYATMIFATDAKSLEEAEEEFTPEAERLQTRRYKQ